MAYRSIFVGPIFDSHLAEQTPAPSLVDYALELSSLLNAHLTVGVGACKFAAASAGIVRAAADLIAIANRERGEQAEKFGAAMLTRSHSAGVEASLELVHAEYGNVADRFARLARVSDVALLEPSDEALSLMQGIVQEVMFGSGRPVIIVPRIWNKPASLETIIVSWDGSAKAARAVGDAMPLLAKAESVEVVSVSGDADETKNMDGTDIAAHLSRHCRRVSVTCLPTQGDVGETLRSHAANTRASLLVMGAFAHNRLRQFVLGGVTRRMLSDPPLPVLMSY